MNQPSRDRPIGGSTSNFDKANNSTGPDLDEVQGEGNYAAAREDNAEQQESIASGKVPAAARAAAPESEAEQAEMLEAERLGKEHAKK